MLVVSTARQRQTRFGGSPYSLWADAEGNFQLVCVSEYDSGNIFLSVRTYEAFETLVCQGCKSIRFRHAGIRLDETRLLDDLKLPTPIEKNGKPAYYLIGKSELSDSAESQEAAYPSYVGTAAEIPF